MMKSIPERVLAQQSVKPSHREAGEWRSGFAPLIMKSFDDDSPLAILISIDFMALRLLNIVMLI